MVSKFFISSAGSMATQWLSVVLSANEKLMKCYHGSADLFATFNPNRSPSEVFSAIHQKGAETGVSHIGCVHLSTQHGVAAGPYCVKNHITFCGLVRNPVIGIDSQYQARLQAAQSSPDSYTLPKPILAWVVAVPGLEDFGSNASVEDTVFVRCAISFLKHVRELERMNGPVFLFEDYTTNYDAFRQILRTITRHQVDDDIEIHAAYENTGNVNKHRRRTVTADETWHSNWSDSQKVIFRQLWDFYYGQTKAGMLYPAVDELIHA